MIFNMFKCILAVHLQREEMIEILLKWTLEAFDDTLSDAKRIEYAHKVLYPVVGFYNKVYCDFSLYNMYQISRYVHI